MKTESLNLAIFVRIQKVQDQRRANWIAGFPADASLEHAHQAELAVLRRQLSTPGRVAGAEETPAGTLAKLYRGGSDVPAGNIFQRIARRIFKSNAEAIHGAG